MSEEKIEQLLDGSAWATFCDTLKASGEILMREQSPQDPLNQAEGFRYLTRVTRMALEQFVEMTDPAAPFFGRIANETKKLGCDNPDSYYLLASVSGRHEYRIRGVRGSLPLLSISTYYGGYGGGRAGCGGNIDSSQIEFDDDGRFEIIVSTQEHPGNWLPMDPETHQLIVRQTYTDRAHESVYDLRIERIGAEGPPGQLDPVRFHDGLLASSQYVRTCANLFADWAEGFAKYPNELREIDVSGAQGDPNLFYYQGYWELADDEALVVQATPPECAYWNFQLNNYWLESLDHRFHRIDLNHAQAAYEPDGSFRIIVAHEDPGLPNWIETAEHRHGTMGLRWVKATEFPKPDCRVVPFGELR